MSNRIKPSLFAAAAVLLGALTWSGVARAEGTPGCGGDGEAACTSKRARSHGKATKVGCPAGSFVDPRNFGECWTCSGKVRTVHAVTSASACGSHIFDGGGTKARFVKTMWGCDAGEFFDLVDGGSCWSCPVGTFRGLTHVKSANACAVSPGAVCDAGMERVGDRCRPSAETQVRNEAAKLVRTNATQIARALQLALGLGGDADLLASLGDKDDAAIAAVTGSQAFKDARAGLTSFPTLSIGAETSASFLLVGGSAETGIAIALDGARPVYWYGGGGYKFGPGVSADAGITVGLWTDQNNEIGGDSQGVVLGLSDLAEIGKLLGEGFDFKAGASLAVAVWFTYPDAAGKIELQGITITPGVSAGVDFGGYVRSTTWQIQ